MADMLANQETPALNSLEERCDSQLPSRPNQLLDRKALIVKFGQIGDVIMAIPAARALYEQGFAIDWVCGRAVYPLLQRYSWIRLIPVNDKRILRGSLPARLGECLHLWRRLVPTSYDLCATLYYDRRFTWITSPVRARTKIALSDRTRNAMLVAGRHHTDEFVRMLLGTEDTCREQSTRPVRPDRLVRSPLPAKVAVRRVALFPGGTSNVLGEQRLRRWPIENYVDVVKRLLARGWEVVLLGGTEDHWVQPHFASLPVIDRVASFSLPEVLSVCDASDAVITHDTGPLHLAGLSSACLVGIFGPTDPATRVPRRPFASGIWGGEGFACRPCYDGKSFAPCRSNACMQQVTPQTAIMELDRLLAARDAQPQLWTVAPTFPLARRPE